MFVISRGGCGDSGGNLRCWRRSKNIKRKNFSPSLFTLSNNNREKVSYKISTNIYQALGVNKKLISLKEFSFKLKELTIYIKINKTKKFTAHQLPFENCYPRLSLEVVVLLVQAQPEK